MPVDAPVDVPVDVPVIGVSFKQTLDEYREIVLQTHVPQNAAQEDIDRLLDKLSRSSERQKSKAHLPTLIGLLADLKRGKIDESNKLLLARGKLDSGDDRMKREAAESKRRNWQPSPKQVNDRAQVQAEIAQSEGALHVLEKKIAIAERQLQDAKGQIGAEA